MNRLQKATCALILIILLPALVLANGSETGHNNGNGHRDHEDSGVPGDVTVDTDIISKNHIDSSSSIDSRVDSYSESTGRATARTGDASAATGSVTVTGDSNDYPASRAASVYSQVCQSGMSGQTRSGGFGISNPDQFCDYLRMADAMWEAYQRELSLPPAAEYCEVVACTVECPVEGYVEAQLKTCHSPHAYEYLTAYRDNLDSANGLLSATEHTSMLDRIAGQLFKPGSILAVLFWL
jgi:hypothetical protein